MESFRFQFPYRVGVADINYGGHVANSALLNFFQDARIAFLAELGPYSEIDLGGCGIIMAEAHVYFKQEMFLGENIIIGVKVTELKRSSWVMEYRIERAGELTASGNTPLICFDYQKRKPCKIPTEFKAALLEYERM